jgi:hypothetical protein
LLGVAYGDAGILLALGDFIPVLPSPGARLGFFIVVMVMLAMLGQVPAVQDAGAGGAAQHQDVAGMVAADV